MQAAKRVVYLFGAGVSLGEAEFSGLDSELSLQAVSENVFKKAKQDSDLKTILADIATDEIKDIERYISLLESVPVKKYSGIASKLRNLFCECVKKGLLQDGHPIKPTLEMALLQMHKDEDVNKHELLKGIISLNYYSLADRAFNQVYSGVNYNVDCRCVCRNYNIDGDIPPLIKMHGSFNWKSGFPSLIIDERDEPEDEHQEMMWIPPGVEKELIQYPFNLLWGKSFELLNCDVLRIIGCSLSQNDWGLISLLFRTQLKNPPDHTYEIEIINRHASGINIRNNNGYLKNIKVLGELEGCQDLVDLVPTNVFESWLKRKLSSFTEKGIPIMEKGLDEIDRLMGGRET